MGLMDKVRQVFITRKKIDCRVDVIKRLSYHTYFQSFRSIHIMVIVINIVIFVIFKKLTRLSVYINMSNITLRFRIVAMFIIVEF